MQNGELGIGRGHRSVFNSPFVHEISYAFGSALGAAAAVVFLVLAGLTLPKDLLKILPLLVFTSPLPITNNLKFVDCENMMLSGCKLL
jgi:hypothetical protein